MMYFYVFIGGGLGSLCRFGLAQWLNRPGGYPLGTLAANGLSCILLGMLVAWVGKQWLAPEFRWLLVTGFCGGFSTFSTFSNEGIQMLKAQQWGMFTLYFTLSLVTGLLGIMAGMKIAE